MWSTLLYFVLYHVKSGELYGGIGTFLEDAGLILPIGTMELTWPAFRADTIAATIKVRIRRFLHQDFKRLCTIFRVHRINLHFCKKNKPRYCSAMRSAIPGLSRWVFCFDAASSFLKRGCSSPQSYSLLSLCSWSWTKSAKHQCFQGFLTLLLL